MVNTTLKTLAGRLGVPVSKIRVISDTEFSLHGVMDDVVYVLQQDEFWVTSPALNPGWSTPLRDMEGHSWDSQSHIKSF